MTMGVNYEIVKEVAFDNFEILGPSMTQVPALTVRGGLEESVCQKIFEPFQRFTIQIYYPQ